MIKLVCITLLSWCAMYSVALSQPSGASISHAGDRDLFRYVFDIPGGYVNDHCLVRKDSLWHLFSIQGTVSATQPWYRDGNQVIIGHATSSDLLEWTLLPPALGVGAPGTLDAAHVTAPYVIERDGVYYMYYGGKEVGYFNGEHFLLATSTDLYTWTRHPKSPILRPDPSWSVYHPPGTGGGSGGPVSGRDAHVVRDDKHGYIFYYVARLKGDPSRPSIDQEYSCVAAATSTDLVNWVDRGPVLVRQTTGLEQNTWGHPESPCVIKRDSLYYLFWKGGDGTRYVISDDPLDFRDRPAYYMSNAHAAEIFEWNGKWYITSCSRRVEDTRHAYSDRTRGLYLAGVRWMGKYPVVTALDAPDTVARRSDSALFTSVLEIPREYINDHSLIHDGSKWHLYFIEGEIDRFRFWFRDGNEVKIGHATSDDLRTWTLHEPALRTGPKDALDSVHVYAPGVIERRGTYYMFYSGQQVESFHGEHLLLATSTDLYTWRKYSPYDIFMPDTSWAAYFPPTFGAGGPLAARDAFILPDEAHGYIMYYVATLRADPKRDSVDGQRSCIAVATSTNLVDWVDRGPALTRRSRGHEEFFWGSPESPSVLKRGERYYLFWKAGNGTRYAISENPLDFDDREEYFLGTSHASKIFEWNGQWYITSCSRSIDDIAHAYSDRTRGLFLARVVWKGLEPTVAPLGDTTSAVFDAIRQLDGLAVTPNPVSRGTRLRIDIGDLRPGAVHIDIFDPTGGTVYSSVVDAEVNRKAVNTISVEIGELAAGVYLVRLRQPGRTIGSVKILVR